MRILVTGGAGFIGSHATDRLLAEGHEVICLDNFSDFYSPAEKRINLSEARMNNRFSLEEADIVDLRSVTEIFNRHAPQAVIHLAARAGIRPSKEKIFQYYETNVTGTLNILQASKESGVEKFIFASSSSVYGDHNKVPFSENQPLSSPASPYAATKIAGENLCYYFAHQLRLNTVVLRFFSVYGERQRPDLAVRKFATKMIKGEPISIYGDGSSGRDFTYISDILDGIIASLKYDVALFEVFNLGNSHPVTVKNLIRELSVLVGKTPELIYEDEDPTEMKLTHASLYQSQKILNYYPRIGIEDGLKRTVEWITKQLTY